MLAALLAIVAAAFLASCTVKVGDSGSDKASETTKSDESSDTTEPESSDSTTTESTESGSTTADISSLKLPGYELTTDEARTKELSSNPSIEAVSNDVQVSTVKKDGEVVGGIITLALKQPVSSEGPVRQYAEGVAGEGGKVDNVTTNGKVIVAAVSSENGVSHTIYITSGTGLLVDVYARDAAATQKIVEAIAAGT